MLRFVITSIITRQVFYIFECLRHICNVLDKDMYISIIGKTIFQM